MTRPEPLLYHRIYHIYNRGNNGENLFLEPRNYTYFLRLYAHYISPVADTFAYCLLRNHFHLLVGIRGPDRQAWPSLKAYHDHASRQFANLFSTYTKAINKAYRRSGSLFAKPFKRKAVHAPDHLATLVVYIHRNPEHHGFVDHFATWPYSSYEPDRRRHSPSLAHPTTITWFGDTAAYLEAHAAPPDEHLLATLGPEDWS